ncbi:MAG: hypothetical protein FWD15_04190 [Alphaproteobacteria bacterium]|nr:hypothetical protein [Alphaproteobacteria bacterium]
MKIKYKGEPIDYKTACDMGGGVLEGFIKAFTDRMLDKIAYAGFGSNDDKKPSLNNIVNANRIFEDIFVEDIEAKNHETSGWRNFKRMVDELDIFIRKKDRKLVAEAAAADGGTIRKLRIEQATALGIREKFLVEFLAWLKETSMDQKLEIKALTRIALTHQNIRLNHQWSDLERHIEGMISGFRKVFQTQYPDICKATIIKARSMADQTPFMTDTLDDLDDKINNAQLQREINDIINPNQREG